MNTKNTIVDLAAFALAGKAIFTISNPATGGRFTFKVRRKAEGSPAFVSVLTGTNNQDDYTYLGTVFADGTYRHGRKSTIRESAPSARAFAWLWPRALAKAVPPTLSVQHEGRCGRCGRPLTVPESIDTGFGPECAGKVFGTA